MQIHAQPALRILQHEPENLQCEMSSNNEKQIQETSVLVSALIIQIILIASEQSLKIFVLRLLEQFGTTKCQLVVSNKLNQE